MLLPSLTDYQDHPIGRTIPTSTTTATLPSRETPSITPLLVARGSFTHDQTNELQETPQSTPAPSDIIKESNECAKRSPSEASSGKDKTINACTKYPPTNASTSLSRTGKIFLACCIAPPILTLGSLCLFTISCECS